MIVHLKKETPIEIVQECTEELSAFSFSQNDLFVLVNSFKERTINDKFENYVVEKFLFDSDIQLASKKYQGSREFSVDEIEVGKKDTTLVITGPCSVESKGQIDQCAAFVKSQDIKVLRAGCFKPRTSPYTFQGMGIKGLKLLAQVRDQYGLKIISEIRDASHADAVIDHVDIIQIGAKAMYDHGILNKCAKTNKPVLLKRGFGTTLQEFVQAAEFILSGGNGKVILCERGIRTFETKTRFTLDLCGVAWLKEHVNLPIFLDPSHAMGYAYGVPDLTRACVAMGVDGLLLETHPNPKEALSDASQQLDFNEFSNLLQSIKPVARAVGTKII
ncbi:MAG: 3-deoxy-7-phosphoheptulonate synthase [Cyclobacteriaceae bacterium]